MLSLYHKCKSEPQALLPYSVVHRKGELNTELSQMFESLFGTVNNRPSCHLQYSQDNLFFLLKM